MLSFLREGLDLKVSHAKGISIFTKYFRDRGQTEFEKIFQGWSPSKSELPRLLKEFSEIDRTRFITEPVIVDTENPNLMLDLFGHHPILMEIPELKAVFDRHWRQYYQWAKVERKTFRRKGRPSMEERDQRIRRWAESDYILQDFPEGEDYWINVISKVDQEIDGIEYKKGQDFFIIPDLFNPKTMKHVGYFPRLLGKKTPKSEIEESISKQFGISRKTVQNILSKKNKTILGKKCYFLCPMEVLIDLA